MDILIVPQECKKLLQITLPAPKDGQPQHFLYDEENLTIYEIVQYSDKFRSWFIDNSFCQHGHFNLLNKVDPLYLFAPQLMKFAKDQFRPLHDICQEYSNLHENSSQNLSRLDYALNPYINWNSICDTQDIDGELFVKFSFDRTIEWLVKKHATIMAALKDHLNSGSSKATLISYASDLLSDYIPDSMINKFKETVRNKHLMTGSTQGDGGHKRPVAQTERNQKPPIVAVKRLSNEPNKEAKQRDEPKNSIARFFRK